MLLEVSLPFTQPARRVAWQHGTSILNCGLRGCLDCLVTDVASHCCLQPTRTRWGRVIYPKRSLHGRLWPSMTQCTILEFNSIFSHLVLFFYPVRLPACVYFVVKYQPPNACRTALFIQAAPEPPPTIIMCSLATTCSFRSVAGLDQFFA